MENQKTNSTKLEQYLEVAQKQYEEGQKLFEQAKQDITYQVSPRFCTTLFDAKEKFEESMKNLEFCEIQTERGNEISHVINEIREKISECLREINDKIKPPKELKTTKIMKLPKTKKVINRKAA